MAEWEIVKFTTRFASIRLMKQEDFFVVLYSSSLLKIA